MDNRMNNQNEPLCRFGPGGDFVCFLQPDGLKPAGFPENRLSKVLNSLSQIISGVLSSEPKSGISVQKTAFKQLLNHKEELEHATEHIKAIKPTNTAAGTASEGNIQFSEQRMLFADNSRTGKRVGSKQKHSIRTPRRASKKRVPVSLCGQGTLFGADFKSIRIA